MSIPSFSAFPEIPQRSTPEADFDAKMYALFQHFATTHRQELLAFIQFLENNVTAIEGAINGVTIGLTHPAAAKFTSLAADSIGGAAVQASPDDATAGRLMKVGAFGLGGNALIPPNNDLNDIGATTGLWRGGEAGIANSPPAGPVIVQHLVRSADAYVQIAVTRGHEPQQMFVRHKTQTYGWSDWEKAIMIDGSGILPDNIEIRNSGPYLSLTDQDTGVKHTISANSTAGHLYFKVDPASNALDPKLLLEVQGARPVLIGKGDVEFDVPIKGHLGIGATATSPATALHIKGTGVTDSKMTVERSGVTGAVGVVSQDLLLNGTGSTGTNGGINFYTGGGSNMRLAPDGTLRPANDGTQNLGNASYRWDVVYASTGTINTSDARTKTEIQDLDEAEHRVAVAAKSLLKKYRIRDAVAEKGDAARWHFGVIAQELAAAFRVEGLDPWRYGVLCWDEWWSAEFEIPAETAPIMREVVERVVHTYPVLDESGEPTGETREKVEEVRKKVDTGEVKIIEPARTELRKYDREEDAPEGPNITTGKVCVTMSSLPLSSQHSEALP